MGHWPALIAGALTLGLAADVVAGPRSTAIRAEFQHLEPCPATNQPRGPCAGYQVDHAVPLCLSGPDIISNLQWLTVEDHKRKTRRDVELCRQARG